jgi:hypothetical protein
MNLGVHQAIDWLTRYKSTDHVSFQQRLQGKRKNIGPVIEMIQHQAKSAERSQTGLLITLVKDPYRRGEEGLWTRLTHVRYEVFVNGPVWAAQIYLHALEGRHGHRR